jgi:hypothetical protein
MPLIVLETALADLAVVIQSDCHAHSRVVRRD